MSDLILVYTIPLGTHSPGITITLPIYGPSMSITSVDWDDGTVNTSIMHNYINNTGSPISYKVTITAIGVTIMNYQSYGAGSTYLTACTSFGNVGITSLSYAFSDCTNLKSVPSSLPTTVTDLSGCFQNASTFNDPNIMTWNTTNITLLTNMFKGASSFNQSLYNWDFSKVINITGMFQNATSYDQDMVYDL
jgi:hypothetical protein